MAETEVDSTGCPVVVEEPSDDSITPEQNNDADTTSDVNNDASSTAGVDLRVMLAALVVAVFAGVGVGLVLARRIE